MNKMSTPFQKACQGANAVTGGLNLADLRKELVARYPNEKTEIRKARRKDLEPWCTRAMGIKRSPRVHPLKKRTTSMDEIVYKACKGSTKKGGGLSVSELKNELEKKFPEDATSIQGATRIILKKKWCHKIEQGSEAKDKKLVQLPRENRAGKQYTDREKRYCRCISHVAAKGNVSSPYAICKKATKQRENVKCMDYYVKEYNMPENEIKAMAAIKNKHVDQFRREVKGEAPVVNLPKNKPEIKKRRIVRSVPRASASVHASISSPRYQW